jgi:hypothetical protein
MQLRPAGVLRSHYAPSGQSTIGNLIPRGASILLNDDVIRRSLAPRRTLA